MDIRKFAKDLKAVGPTAPIRAAYEVAKRSGIHGVALSVLSRTAKPRPLHPMERFRLPIDLPAEVAKRALEDARLIVDEGHRAFGQRFPIACAADWSNVDVQWPTDKKWWDIDIRTDARLGDVKWVWEIGRHRDLVVLARAAAIEPGAVWADQLNERLRWWLEATPGEVSVHWYSNLEISIRMVALLQIVSLCGEQLTPLVSLRLEEQVAQARRHLFLDFPYTLSSMRNNHLLGDALGILAIGKLLNLTGDERDQQLARRSFERQLDRHMRNDGSMIEDSLSYHRFVIEMLCIKIMIDEGDAKAFQALAQAAQHLVNLGGLDGDLPQWGDWDEGRVLASSGPALDVSGSALLALALTGTELPCDARLVDEVAWYAASTSGDRPIVPERNRSGGLTYLRRNGWRVWLKSGSGPSHQHADLGHVAIQHEGRWLTTDPGTGTYNGSLDIRNGFRTSGIHNGLQLDGAEMYEPHRAFRWLSTGRCARGATASIDGVDVIWTAHDAFERIDGGGVVIRVVVLSEDAVVVADWTSAGFSGPKRTTVHLAPSATVAQHRLTIAHGVYALSGEIADANLVRGSDEPFMGWHSATYGSHEPTIALTWTPKAPISWWGLANNSAPLEVAIDDDRLSAFGVNVQLEHSDGFTAVTVTSDKSGISVQSVGSLNA